MEKKAIYDDLKEVDDTPKSDHAFTVNELVSTKNIRKKVVLGSQKQAKAFSILETIAERHNNKFLKTVIAKQLEFNISVGGRGRNDIVEVSKFKSETQHGYMDKILSFAGMNRK